MIFPIKDRIREFFLKQARANFIITQYCFLTSPKSGRKKLVHKKIGESLVGNFAAQSFFSMFKTLSGTNYWRTAPGSAAYYTSISTAGSLITNANLGQIDVVTPGGIGWGNAAAPVPSIMDYTSPGLIGNGSGAGQLNYSSHLFMYKGVVGNSLTLGIQRNGTNNSGATINVTEVYMIGYQNPNYFVMYHDTETQSVLNLGTITTEIDFTLTT